MNLGLATLAVLLLLVLIAVAGCTANAPFRTNFDPIGGDRANAVIETTPDYKMGFVEFDDQGWFWNARQLRVVEQMISDEAAIHPGHAAGSQGIILVLFVHGWKDNAAYGGDGVTAFGEILQQLNQAELAQSDHPARKVVGVYAGWRGLSATIEPFKELSFWDRKDTAHKVGGYGAMTELLVDLENIQTKSLDSLAPGAPPTELIIIGHSFGAAAVYSALSQIITERFVDTVEKGQRLKPLGDQVILLNPAFEAQRHYDLNRMARSIGKYPPDQRPVLSVFTSKGDWATHYVFPIGQFFSTLFQKNRDREQTNAGLQTIGWFKPFITHELIYNADASSPATQASTLDAVTHKHKFHDRKEMSRSVSNVKAQRDKWHPNGGTPQTYYFDDSILKPMDDFRPGDPFLTVLVDEQIMHDHTDIANPVLINFLREYIQFCRVDPKDRLK
jgi:alpha/beta hydrolase family protein DUF900